jgi:uncharacterized delta-60 repeat protein
MHMKKVYLALSIVLTLSANHLFGQAGIIDNSFGNNGIVTTSIGSHNSTEWDMAIQSDWSIVVGGFAYNGTDSDFALIRYNPNGGIDSSFGTNGMVTTSMGPGNDIAYSIGLQPDGKIIAGGAAWNGTNFDFALARYNTDGSLDMSYGNNGKVITAIGPKNDKIRTLKIQSDWSVVVGGIANNGSNNDFALARYTPNGTLDSTFGVNGTVLTPMSAGGNDMAFSLAIQSDWSIVVGGVAYNGTDFDFAMARYKTNGTLDSTFGTNGKVITPVGPAEDFVWSLVVRPDQKILMGGYAVNDSLNEDYAIVQYNTNGSIDSTFGNNGKVLTVIGDDDDELYSMVLQPDGKIVAGGTTDTSGYENFALLRYNPDGTPDPTFGANGQVVTYMNSGANEIYTVALQPDGKIVAGGYASDSVKSSFCVARYLSGLSLGVIDFKANDNSVLIYPNPVAQNATLEYTLTKEEQVSIRLVDLQGKTVKTFIENQTQTSGDHTQPLLIPQTLPAGSYVLVISSTEGQMSIKIMK